jgi:lupus La protein
MLDMTGGPANLPIKIELLCTKFRRMVRFRPISAVVTALRESKFLEVSGPDGLEEVKRKVPYDPSIPRSKAESRSIYAKGFGDEEPSSQFDIEAFFAPYGPTNAVRLRRTPDKLFKGSVFVEFQDEETQEKFLALDPKPMWKGKHQLKIMSKKEYMDEKGQEIRDGVTQPNASYFRGRGRGRGRGGNHRGRGDRGGRDRGDRDPNDWKKRREEDRANGFPSNRGRQNNRGGGRRDHKGPRDNDRNREREGQNG